MNSHEYGEPHIPAERIQLELLGGHSPLVQLSEFPDFRYMGGKQKLLPWIHRILAPLDFESAFDPFCGTSCVAYLMKAMGRRVHASDFLNFPATIAAALVENSHRRIDGAAVRTLLAHTPGQNDFIERTFSGVFFTREDLRFLDRISANIHRLADPYQRALARTALIRSCLKRQPRGVFTISGDLARYDDGRRDLRLSIEEHFLEQIAIFNGVVFDNGRTNRATRADVFDVDPQDADLVYLDPPYVPRSDDNCYMKRYHFLEGLSCYWQGVEIDSETRTKKIRKPFTPFSYRRTALDAFERMFARFRNAIIVLSYSSNGYPDRDQLEELLSRYKRHVRIFERPYRYQFGTHEAVERAQSTEFLFVGT